jgi:hypothetical protein
VNLDDIHAGRNGAARGVRPRTHGRLDVRSRHGARVRHCFAVRNGGRRNDVMRPPAIELGRDERRVQPRSDRGRLASGVPELDRNFLALRVRKVDDLYGAHKPLETKH